jgi:enolase-phosphatase E1
MEHDSKISPLKALQGRIWQEGYKKGELRGEVYPDVPPALKRWREDGKRIYIYSSGSVLAQKLLFESTAYGDLTQLLDGYVDTKVGSKMDPASYIKIAAQIGCETGQVLFVSDAVRELEAAQSAGLQVALAVRATDEAASPSFVEIHSFSDIFPD